MTVAEDDGFWYHADHAGTNPKLSENVKVYWQVGEDTIIKNKPFGVWEASYFKK